jgi:hypothetical protein
LGCYFDLCPDPAIFFGAQDESVDELRKRVANQFNAGELSAAKRRKFEIPDPVSQDKD